MRYMRYVERNLCTELRAHAALCREKSFYRDAAADLKLCYGGGHFPNRYRAYFQFGLPLDTGFNLHRTVREFEVDQWQPGGRVAQRFYRGDFSRKRSRIKRLGAHPYVVAGAGAGAAAGAAVAAGAVRSSDGGRARSSRIIGDGAVTASFINTVKWRSTASLNLNACSSSTNVSLSHSMFSST